MKRLEPIPALAPRLREAWERYGLPWRSPRCTTAARATSSCAGSPRSGTPPRACARKASTFAPSPSGRCSALRLALPAHRAATAITSPACSTCAATRRAPTALAQAAARCRGEASTIRCSTARLVAAAAAPLCRGTAAASAAEWRRPANCSITGATGTLGRAFARICEERGLRLLPDQPRRARHRRRRFDRRGAGRATSRGPSSTRPASCGRRCRARAATPASRATSPGPQMLARACARRGIPLVTFSSDLVFDGRHGPALRRGRPASPPACTGAARPRRSAACCAILARALIVRTSAFFGPWDRYNFVWRSALGAAPRRDGARPARQWVSPTYVPDLVPRALDLLIDGETRHLAPGQPGRGQLVRPGAGDCRSGEARLLGGELWWPMTSRAATPASPASAVCSPRPLDNALDDFAQYSEAFRQLSA